MAVNFLNINAFFLVFIVFRSYLKVTTSTSTSYIFKLNITVVFITLPRSRPHKPDLRRSPHAPQRAVIACGFLVFSGEFPAIFRLPRLSPPASGGSTPISEADPSTLVATAGGDHFPTTGNFFRQGTMGRGNAVMAVAVFCLVFVAFQSEVAHAKTYIVGDGKGWTFGVQSWPSGKSFNAGDVLVFKYPQGVHTVAVVNQAGLDSCSVIPKDAKVFTTGNDQITLVSGNNNFICTIADHCSQGLKMTAHAV